MKRHFTLFALVMATVMTAGAATLTKTATPFKADKKSMPKAAIVAKANEHNFPTGEYKSLGKGLYTDDMLLPAFGYEPMTWEVEIQQSTEDPNFYRVISPYGKAFADAMLATNNVQLTETQYDSAGTTKLDIDASDPNNVYFAKTMIGLDWNYGPVYIGIPSSKQVTFKDGIFTAPVRGVAYGDNDGAVAMNTNQKWRIVLPGVEAKDYSMVFSFENQCTSNRKILGKITVGNDIDKVKYAILPNFQEDEVMGVLADVAKKGLDLTVRGEFSWTMSEVSKETIILVGLNRAGQQVAYQWGTCYYLDNDDTAWTYCGTATLNVGFIKTFFKVDDESLEVPLQRNVQNPRIIRLSGPFENSKYSGSNKHNCGLLHYITINASDDRCIYVQEGPVGLDYGYGLIRLSSTPEYYLGAGFDWEEIAETESGATLGKDNVLSFPRSMLLISVFGKDNGDWYNVENTDTSIKLPADFDLLGVSDVTVDDNADAPARIYNLQGIPVNNPEAGQVYIVVRGNRSTKVVF